jgi:hypothetical protein
MLGKFVVKKELDVYGVKPPASLEIALTGLGHKGIGEATAIKANKPG